MTASKRSMLGLGTFSSYQDAEVALDRLKQAGFADSQLAFLTKCRDRHDSLSTAVVEDQTAGQYVGSLPSASNPITPQGSGICASITNGMISGLRGIVDTPEQLDLLETGPVVAAGRLKNAVAFTQTRTGSLDEVFRILNVATGQAQTYIERLYRGDCLIGVEGSVKDVHRAEELLLLSQVNYWQIYEMGTVEPTVSEPLSEAPFGDGQSSVLQTHHPLPAPAAIPVASIATMPAPTDQFSGMATPQLGESLWVAVGVFRHYLETELALRELQSTGFPMDTVAVVARDSHRVNAPDAVQQIDLDRAGREYVDPVADVNLAAVEDDQIATGAAQGLLAGGSLGGIAGLLVGLGTLAIPGVGPVFWAGSVATTIATTLAGGAIGAAAGGVLGAIAGLGIPEDRAQVYRDRLAIGHYLVIVSGTEAQIHQSKKVLKSRGIEEWGIYQTPREAALPAADSPDTVREAQQGLSPASYPTPGIF